MPRVYKWHPYITVSPAWQSVQIEAPGNPIPYEGQSKVYTTSGLNHNNDPAHKGDEVQEEKCKDKGNQQDMHMMRKTQHAYKKPEIEQVNHTKENERLQSVETYETIPTSKDHKEQARQPATRIAKEGGKAGIAERRHSSKRLLAIRGRAIAR
jgi:hypothetical protein